MCRPNGPNRGISRLKSLHDLLLLLLYDRQPNEKLKRFAFNENGEITGKTQSMTYDTEVHVK